MKSHIAILAAVLVPLSSSALGADRVLVTFTGTVSSITDPVDVFSDFSVGDPVTGRYTYGSTLPDTQPHPGYGTYRQSFWDGGGLWITVRSTEFAPYVGSVLEIGVANNYPIVHDMFSLQTQILEPPDCVAGGSLLIFKDLSDRAITGDALFLLAPDLSAFPLSFGQVVGYWCGSSGQDATLEFNVTSVTTVETPIPTLSTWALAITALSLMACGTIVLRRRRVAS